MKYRLVFNGPMYLPAVNALRGRIADILVQPGFEELTLVFSSEGGSTDEGLSLYNFIRSLPRPITIHAAGHVGSSAVPVFVGGHRRTCAPDARFFFHAYDWGFDGRQVGERIAEAMIRLDSDIDLARGIVERHTNIPAETVKAIYCRSPRPVVVAPSQAVEWGIVEQVTELNPDGGVQPGVTVWTVGW